MSAGEPRVVGSGPDRVIALHGWFGSSGGWGSFPEYIDTETMSYAFVDYRGYGRRLDHDGEFTIAEISADVIATADALGWDTFHLLGHSMGGLAVQHVLMDVPDRVLRLAAVSGVPATGGGLDDPTYEIFASAPDSDDTRAALTDMSTGSRLAKTFLNRIVAESRRDSTVEAFGGHLPSWARTDISQKIAGSPHPVKAIVGEHDPVLNADVMRATWLEFYPNAELEVIANAGHYAMYETPVWLATTLEEFYTRQPATP